MYGITKLIKNFADKFMDYANIGFRYIDIPNYNEKISYNENNAGTNKKRKSA